MFTEWPFCNYSWSIFNFFAWGCGVSSYDFIVPSEFSYCFIARASFAASSHRIMDKRFYLKKLPFYDLLIFSNWKWLFRLSAPSTMEETLDLSSISFLSAFDSRKLCNAIEFLALNRPLDLLLIWASALRSDYGSTPLVFHWKLRASMSINIWMQLTMAWSRIVILTEKSLSRISASKTPK